MAPLCTLLPRAETGGAKWLNQLGIDRCHFGAGFRRCRPGPRASALPSGQIKVTEGHLRQPSQDCTPLITKRCRPQLRTMARGYDRKSRHNFCIFEEWNAKDFGDPRALVSCRVPAAVGDRGRFLCPDSAPGSHPRNHRPGADDDTPRQCSSLGAGAVRPGQSRPRDGDAGGHHLFQAVAQLSRPPSIS